jgi:hypothetical protein
MLLAAIKFYLSFLSLFVYLDFNHCFRAIHFHYFNDPFLADSESYCLNDGCSSSAKTVDSARLKFDTSNLVGKLNSNTIQLNLHG